MPSTTGGTFPGTVTMPPTVPTTIQYPPVSPTTVTTTTEPAATTTTEATGPATTTTPTTVAEPNEVRFVLRDGTIELQGQVTGGENMVEVTNEGTVDHELVLVAAEGGGAALPTDDRGAVDEGRLPADSVLGEIELGPGQTTTRPFLFTPGQWVALCNIVAGTVSHFANGMWMDFTVD